MRTRSENFEEIFATSATVQRLMRSYMQESFIALGIGPSEGHVLHVIAESQQISLKDLAGAMHLTPGAITQLIDSLVQVGFVNRSSSEQDRRVTVASLTTAGTQTIAKMKQFKEKMFTSILEDLNDNELASYVNVQRKMLKYLEDHCQNVKK